MALADIWNYVKGVAKHAGTIGALAVAIPAGCYLMGTKNAPAPAPATLVKPSGIELLLGGSSATTPTFTAFTPGSVVNEYGSNFIQGRVAHDVEATCNLPSGYVSPVSSPLTSTTTRQVNRFGSNFLNGEADGLKASYGESKSTTPVISVSFNGATFTVPTSNVAVYSDNSKFDVAEQTVNVHVDGVHTSSTTRSK